VANHQKREVIITEQNQNRRPAAPRANAVRPQPSSVANNSEIRQPRRENGEIRVQSNASVNNTANRVPERRSSQTPNGVVNTVQSSTVSARRPGQPAPNRGQNPTVRQGTANTQRNTSAQSQSHRSVAATPMASSAQRRPTQGAAASGVARTQSVNPDVRPSNADRAVAQARQNRTAYEQNKQPALQNRPVSARKDNGSAHSNKLPINVNNSSQIQSPNKQSVMNARTTDISKVRENKKDENDDGDYTSGEGGNTVVSIVKAVIYITFVFVISVFLSYFIIVIGNDVFAFVKSDEAVEVVIPEYATLDNVADILYESDVIKYPNIFKIFARVKKFSGEFVAGTYTVTPMMNYESLLDAFKEKKVRGTIELTIPEGYTTDEIIDLFVANGIGTKDGFIDVIQNYDFDYWFIDELEENGMNENRIYRLDGYLFPDTYQFYLESSEVTVINKLLKRFSQIFNKDHRDACEFLGYTVDEIVTLASIIEKEAGSPAEFFKVSSVFHNRLNNPWNYPKLESDATIVYAIQHDTGERTVIKDTNYETPYNTYKYDGLPPGPISNPSASAMLAAVQPHETNYFFFIANKGMTYFSETKAQHDKYIEQFRNEAQNETN